MTNRPVTLRPGRYADSLIRVSQPLFDQLPYMANGKTKVVAMVQNQVRFESTALGVHSHSEEVEVVYIDALLVSSVGFDLDRDSIILNVPHYDPSDWVRVSDLFVRPYSPEDWDIIQLNANSLSGTLLNQVQWVVKNQVMLACSPGSIPIRIITVRLEPLSNQGWISDTTRIHIEPQPHPQPQKLAKPEAPSYQWFRNPFSAQQPRPEDGKNAVSGPDASYRVVEKPGAYCFEAVVCDRALEVGTEFVARLGIIPFHLIQDDETDVHYMKCVVATQMSSRRGIQLAPEIVSAFKFTLGTRVYLEVVTLSELKLSNTLVIRYADPIDEAMQQRVLDRLMTGMEKTSGQDSEKTRKLPVLVPNNAFIEWVESTTPGEKSQPQPFNIFTEAEVFLAWTLPELKTKVEWREYMPLKCYTKPKPQATWSNKGLDAHKLVPEAVKEFINDCIRLFRDSKEPFNMLLKGAQGSGKSTMLDFISIRLKVNQSGIFASSLQCQTVIGKKPSHLAQEWGNILQECVYRYPSVLIFDDLDRLCRDPDGTQSASPSQEALHLMSLASVFQKLVSNANFRGIPVLASVSSISALHSSLRPGKGKYLFARHMDLPLPQKELRHKMIQLHLNPYIKDEPLLEEIAQITEGFTPFDLTRLAAHLRDQSDLGREELKSMTAAFRPLSLMNSKLEKPSSKGWSDIGGLNNVRKVITETIVWPGKYPQLFAQCGLRLQSGLLLYGAPGTGKTLIAGVVAKECGMNLITIKGPELFSKYIGASEAAVRSTFERAQAAQPCILFFDEFDSLAPKRGHDSTGVTDRVVNQLLTQLDGVESLDTGIFVMAASSRPDLIDPALLRPGRLDRKALCPMPTEQDRLDILNALGREMHFESRSEDLRIIAGKTNGLTGADIQALLYTARLNALRENMQEQVSAAKADDVSASGEIPNSSARPNGNDSTVVHRTYCHSGESWQIQPSIRRSPGSSESVEMGAKTIPDAPQRAEVNGGQLGVEEAAEKFEEPSAASIPVESKFSGLEAARPPPSNQAELTITRAHLEAALKDTRPSVSIDELQKFERIYAMFGPSLNSAELSVSSARNDEVMEIPEESKPSNYIQPRATMM